MAMRFGRRPYRPPKKLLTPEDYGYTLKVPVAQKTETRSMKVLALDPSLTATGYATGPKQYGVLRPVGSACRGVLRIIWIRDTVLALCEGVDLVVIEGTSFGSQGTSFIDLAELRGALRVALHESGMRVVEVSPSSLKKYATGRGNAPKDLVLVEAVKRLGYQGSDGNEADALWLWQMAAGAYGLAGAVVVPQAHRDTKKPVRWPAMAEVGTRVAR